MAKDKEIFEGMSELGIDPSRPEQAVEQLRSLRASGTAAAHARIAAAAGYLSVPAAAEFLAEMEQGASGALRREIRRALFRLRQHGIEAPSAVSPQPRAVAPVAEANVTALISPVDPEGARLAWMFKVRSQGGLAWMQGLTSEREGLVGANVIHVTRRELREERQAIERRTSLKLVEADYRLADFMLCEAYRRTPESRLGQVGNFLALRAEILAAAPPAEFHHPTYDEFARTLDLDPSPDLLKEPELEWWVIPESDLKPYMDEIDGIRQSPLVLNQYQQQERVDAVVGRAIEEFFSGERGELMRRRFEDTAYYLARAGRTNAAQWAASAAARIRDGQAKRLPFFAQYVMRSIALVVSREQTKTEQQPRLIMTPAEAMRAQAAARARQRR